MRQFLYCAHSDMMDCNVALLFTGKNNTLLYVIVLSRTLANLYSTVFRVLQYQSSTGKRHVTDTRRLSERSSLLFRAVRPLQLGNDLDQ
jgi:hypothetical protein